MSVVRAVIHKSGPTIGFTLQDVSARSLQEWGGGDGSTYRTSRPRHDLDFWEVVERQNTQLPPYNANFFYERPCRPYVSIQRLRAYPTSAHLRLVSGGADGSPNAHQAGVSGGLVQDWCGIVNLKIFSTTTPSLLIYYLVPM